MDVGKKVVSNKWVFRVKHNSNGSVASYKTRLVARGFQQIPGLDFFDTYSPVVKTATIQVIFSLTASNRWDIQQVDINNAFLNGDLQEDVYMQHRSGFVDPEKPSFVCKLHKAIYGLRQAPRTWFDKLRSFTA